MRFRMGIIIGFCLGYYLGAKAGRQRYEQINAKLRRVKASDPYEAVTGTFNGLGDSADPLSVSDSPYSSSR